LTLFARQGRADVSGSQKRLSHFGAVFPRSRLDSTGCVACAGPLRSVKMELLYFREQVLSFGDVPLQVLYLLRISVASGQIHDLCFCAPRWNPPRPGISPLPWRRSGCPFSSLRQHRLGQLMVTRLFWCRVKILSVLCAQPAPVINKWTCYLFDLEIK